MLLSAGCVAAELQGDCMVVASDGVSWLDVGVSSTGQMMNHLLPVWSTATQDVVIIIDAISQAICHVCVCTDSPFCW